MSIDPFPTPVRAVILNEIRKVAREHDRALGAIDDGSPLLSLGLDSLCFAILVFRLEERLKIDPFNASEVRFPHTLGDFIEIYASASVAI